MRAFFEGEWHVDQFRTHLVDFPAVELLEVGDGAEVLLPVGDFALGLTEQCESVFVFVLWFVVPKLQDTVFGDR